MAGVRVVGNGIEDVLVAGNAIHVRDGGPALPGSRPGLRLTSNVDCGRVRCFADPERGDFSPAPGAALDRRGPAAAVAGTPADDFFRERRAGRPRVGAIEQSGGPIQVDSPIGNRGPHGTGTLR